MPRPSEATADAAARERMRARCEALTDAAGGYQLDAAKLVRALAEQFRRQATYVSDQRRKGWQTESRATNDAAIRCDGIAGELEKYERPPADAAPVREPVEITPSNPRTPDEIGTAVREMAAVAGVDPNLRAGDPKTDQMIANLERRLDEAFPLPAVDASTVPVHITYLRDPIGDRKTWCETTTGIRGYPGSATCQPCKDAYAASLEPPTPGAEHMIMPSEPPAPNGERAEYEIGGPTESICTMGPGCPVHPGIQVIHPPGAPADLVVGPDGGQEELPRDVVARVDGPAGGAGSLDEVAARYRAQHAPHFDGTTAHLPVISPVGPSLPVFSAPVQPTGPRPRLSWDEVERAGAARLANTDHLSISAIGDAEDCGVKFALRATGEAAPAWWNVAGTALHVLIQQIEQAIALGEPVEQAIALSAPVDWPARFATAIEMTEKDSGVAVNRWRTAKGGSEGYDFWRVQGAEYLGMYHAWRRQRAADGWQIAPDTSGADPVPMLEWAFRLPVAPDTPPIDGFIDQVWYRPTTPPNGYQLEIIDLKFGATLPADPLQLAGYAHALAYRFGLPVEQIISAGYYQGRKGEIGRHYDNIREVLFLNDVRHRARMAHRMAEAGIVLPRRSTFCVSCGVRDLCPVGAS